MSQFPASCGSRAALSWACAGFFSFSAAAIAASASERLSCPLCLVPLQLSRPNYFRLVIGVGFGVGFGRKSERKKFPTPPSGSVFLMVSGRVRRFLRRCSVGVGLGVGAVTAGTVGVAASSGAAVGGVAVSAGVAVGNSMGAGVATVDVPMAAGQFSRVGLFARHWATPEIIAKATETIPTPIAQRARRWVCPCLASPCLRSISLRISASRSDAIMISFGGSVESD
jgi:hypothetical protein